MEIGIRAQRVGIYACARVLYHIAAVAVVDVHEREGLLVEHVEEFLLRVHIILYRLMIVEVVTGKVGEYASGEFQTGDTALFGGVG